MAPLISVIMAVYNGEKYLDAAIRSIIHQTINNFEFIILDDGSIDSTPSIISKYVKSDNRIIFIRNKENLGLASSLNKAISISKGKYIARMDADDISLPTRLETQIKYLEKNPNVMVLGGSIIKIDENNYFIKHINMPTDRIIIRWNIMMGGPVVMHSTVMFRKAFFKKYGLYKEIRTSQDRELWTRMLKDEFLEIANVEKVILFYRVHKSNISNLDNLDYHLFSNNICKKSVNMVTNMEVPLEVINAYRHNVPHFLGEEEKFEVFNKWYCVLERFSEYFQLEPNEIKKIVDILRLRIISHYSLNPFNKCSINPLKIFRNVIKLKKYYGIKFFSIKLSYWFKTMTHKMNSYRMKNNIWKNHLFQ